MSLSRHEWILVAFNLAYILPFGFYYVAIRNFEFLWYVVVLVFFFGLILATIRRSRFPYHILWGLSLWGLLHMAGGGVSEQGNSLYALPLLPFAEVGDTMILKYDQFVHAFGFFMATLVVHHLLQAQLTPAASRAVIVPIAVIAGMGLGALNELVEFAAVLLAEETGVGGYYNNALDLAFNALGAILAGGVIGLRWYVKE